MLWSKHLYLGLDDDAGILEKNSESSSPGWNPEILHVQLLVWMLTWALTLSGEIWVFLTKNPTSSHPIIIISLDGDVWKTWKIIKVHLTKSQTYELLIISLGVDMRRLKASLSAFSCNSNQLPANYQFWCWPRETLEKSKCS